MQTAFMYVIDSSVLEWKEGVTESCVSDERVSDSYIYERYF